MKSLRIWDCGLRISIAVMLAVIVFLACGCSAEYPLKWKPTQQQKQAADLAAKDIAALEKYTEPEGEPIRLEALIAAETTQTYIGLPDERLQPKAPGNAAVIAAAAADAARPAPTAAEFADATVAEIQRKSDSIFGIADSVLAIIASVAGTYGLTKLGGKVNGWRQQKDTLQEQVNLQAQALKEIVTGIGTLSPEVKTQVKAAMDGVQTTQTELLVAAAKAK